MAYTVLARRYRSCEFGEVVGQESIARTLRNAIETDRVAHAYLFVGTRGVGKTSMARIFAKALNGGSPEVDGAIMSGRDTDVIEIDAASNSKVEETREIIANAVYRPLRGRFKIYIIDEVHMLSSAAFNALLKTLEEPPSHVKFVLCTTETHKVPATIQSRCQRFDFRNLSSGEIAGHLAMIAEREGVRAGEEVLLAVARLGNGSMRDALSLLDRLMAASPGGELEMSVLERVLGLPAGERIASIAESALSGDAKSALEATDALLGSGVEAERVVSSLGEWFHALMLARICGEESSLLELGGEARRRAGEQASRASAEALVHVVALCDAASRSMRSSATPRALLDAFVARLSMTDRLAEVASLLEGGGGRGPEKKA